MHIVTNKLVGGYVSEIAAEGGSTIIVIEDSDTTANRKFQNYRYVQSKGLTELGAAVHPYGVVIIPDSVKERATAGEIDLTKYHVEVNFNREVYAIALNALLALEIGDGIEFTKIGAGYADGAVSAGIPPFYASLADKYLKINHTASGLEWADIPEELPDQTGASAGDVLTIGSEGLEWAEVPEELPTITSGDAGKVLTVNAGETGIEWTEVPDELPTIASGDAGKVLTVNAGETGVEWAEIPTELPDQTGASAGDVLAIGSDGLEWVTPSGGELWAHQFVLVMRGVSSRQVSVGVVVLTDSQTFDPYTNTGKKCCVSCTGVFYEVNESYFVKYAYINDATFYISAGDPTASGSVSQGPTPISASGTGARFEVFGTIEHYRII